MAKVDKWRCLRKALVRGIQYAAVTIAALQTVPVPEGIGVERQVTVSFVIGLIGAVAKGIQNYQKTSRRAPFLGSRSGLVLLLAAGLATTLHGCLATQGTDGAWTVQVDQSALDRAWDRYEAMERHKDDLERERKNADLSRRLAIDLELQNLEPDLKELGEVLGVDGQLRAVGKKHQ